MNEILSEEEDAHRTLILSLSGFSFTGLIGLIVLDANIAAKL
jgi:hypothetical protein